MVHKFEKELELAGVPIFYETRETSDGERDLPTWDTITEFVILVTSKVPVIAIEGTNLLYAYSHSKGAYVHDAEKYFNWIIYTHLKNEHAKPKFVSAVKHALIALTKGYKTFDEAHPYHLCVKNGVFNIKTGKFSKHSSKFRFLSYLNIEYNPDAICPNILTFLQECHPESSEDIVTMLQYLGYSLTSNCDYQKGMLITGEGRNGKGVWMAVLDKFFGDSSCAVTLNEIAGDRFATADLHRKKINILADEESGILKETGMIKKLIAGERVRAQHKGKAAFKFDNYSKMLFAANKPPNIKKSEHSFSWLRRWLLVEWGVRFDGTVSFNDLVSKLTTKDEFSGLLNLAIKHYQDLIEKKKFAGLTIEEIELKWAIRSNPFYVWADANLDFESSDTITSVALFEDYKSFCIKFKIENNFSSRGFAKHD